jgi:hypothetical protein
MIVEAYFRIDIIKMEIWSKRLETYCIFLSKLV